MSEKQREKTRLCRPRFTEENEPHTEVKAKSKTTPKKTLTAKAELLDKLRRSKVIIGETTIDMMERFRAFPWAQNTMLEVNGMDVVLMEYLEENMGMDGTVLAQ